MSLLPSRNHRHNREVPLPERLINGQSLGDVSRIQLEHMVNILISRGYLLMDTGQYATLSLSAKANAVLRGQEQVMMALPVRDLKQTRREQRLAAMPDYGVDDELFQKLRRVRERLAAKEFVPAYIVFSDATLRDMCNKRPSDPEEMLAISGVGKYKMDKYGEAFLLAIAEYAAGNPE